MKRVGDSSDRGGFLLVKKAKMASRIGRHLLTRQPPILMPQVPLDGVVIDLLKQQLPAFYAVDISSLNKRFHQTTFEKPTIFMGLGIIDEEKNYVDICLTDGSKAVSDSFKERSLSVPVADLMKTLANITGQGVVRRLLLYATLDEVPVLNAVLKLEKFSPSELSMPSIKCPQELFATVVRRFASNLRKADFDFANHPEEEDSEMDWHQLKDCLLPLTELTNLKELSIRAARPLPPSDWLKNILQANSHLKLLTLTDEQLESPIVTDAVSAVANVPVIRVVCDGDGIEEHVETDLCGRGQCTLTRIALNMPKTSTLKLVVSNVSCMIGNEFFCGDALRVAYYLLSLSKTGINVVVQALFVSVEEEMEQFLEDLRHYHPRMALTWRSDGNSVACISASRHRRWHYMVRVGSVKLYLLLE